MSTYYKHTKTETVEVPYSFRCEQCLKDSGPLHAIISGAQAEMNSNFKKAGRQETAEIRGYGSHKSCKSGKRRIHRRH